MAEGEHLYGGTNNSLSAAGVSRLAKKLAAKRAFSASTSVFLDIPIGSGAGIPCIYVALRYGVRCIGVEKTPELVEIAKRFAKSVGLSEDQCRFLCRDATELPSHFYIEHGVTHVLIFDACFGEDALARLYRRLARTRDNILVGCSTVKTRSTWSNSEFQQIGESTNSLKMSGKGALSFCFALWKLSARKQRRESIWPKRKNGIRDAKDVGDAIRGDTDVELACCVRSLEQRKKQFIFISAIAFGKILRTRILFHAHCHRALPRPRHVLCALFLGQGPTTRGMLEYAARVPRETPPGALPPRTQLLPAAPAQRDQHQLLVVSL